MAETPKLAIQCGFFPILFSSYSFLLYLFKKKKWSKVDWNLRWWGATPSPLSDRRRMHGLWTASSSREVAGGLGDKPAQGQ